METQTQAPDARMTDAALCARMPACASCGRETEGKMFTLHRFVHRVPVVPLAISTRKKIPLCDGCYPFFRRARYYRYLGFAVLVAGLWGGNASVYVAGWFFGLWLAAAGVLAGIYIIVRNRHKIAALEKRVGF